MFQVGRELTWPDVDAVRLHVWPNNQVKPYFGVVIGAAPACQGSISRNSTLPQSARPFHMPIVMQMGEKRISHDGQLCQVIGAQ